MSDAVLAIDFGTTNSLVGAWKDGQRIEAITLDPTAADPTMMRTLLYFPNPDLCYYGHEAISHYLENEMEGRLFRSFKSQLPNQSYLGTMVENRIVTLESMVGIFLLELRKRAEKQLGCEVTSAVIGRPARYSMNAVNDGFALHRMEKAAEFAGFKHVEFVPEPLAAAFDYRRTLTEEKLVLIGDFGGGTSDFTLIRLGPYAYKKEHVLGITGCPLAGDAFDSVFMSHKLNSFFGAQSRYRVSMGTNLLTMPKTVTDRLNLPSQIVHLKERATYEFIREVRKGALSDEDKAAIDRLFVLIEDQQIFAFFEEIEATKRRLSSKQASPFKFDYPDLEIETEFSRAQFEQWSTDHAEKIFAAMDDCLSQSGTIDADVDLVYLTGGTAQVPLIRDRFLGRFGEAKLRSQSHFHSVLGGLIESASFSSR